MTKKEEMIVNDENHIEVAKIEDVQNGKMKRVKINGKEILIANINGKYFAIDNRCGHSNAALSSGVLNGNIVTCPLHGAQFDVTTGKKIKDPDFENLPSSPPSRSFEKLPDDMKKYIEYAFSLVRDVNTHDQERYRVIVDNDSIKIG